MHDLSRREFLGAAAAAAVASSSARVTPPETPALRIDALAPGALPQDPAEALKAGLGAFVADLSFAPRNYYAALEAFAAFLPDCRDRGLFPVLRADDLLAAQREKKLGVVLACQDAQILDSSSYSVVDWNLRNLEVFHGLGLRVLQLTHNDRNALGDGYLEPTNAGLSRLGKAVVAKMNGLRMLIDLSHCGDQTTTDALNLSARPCAISHAGCRALLPSGRNKPDETLRLLAQKGGVFGIFNMSYWLTRDPTPTLEHLLAHVDHAVQVAGVEHVAIGSDLGVDARPGTNEQWLKGFGGFVTRNLGAPGCEWPAAHVHIPELVGPDRLVRIGEGLRKKGYKPGEIDGILGRNFLRLLRDVIG